MISGCLKRLYEGIAGSLAIPFSPGVVLKAGKGIMNRLNVTINITALSERGLKTLARIIDRAHYHVACSQEAHAHYGFRFTRTDTCMYFIRGVLEAIVRKV
ncbi:hypothetical protein G3142_003977 [Salmonella enterica subsp. enterica serovar Montevideo]|nr:hypothetical protein [Salmonella enterica subsp. enterica serovar Montevideo]EEK7813041.1 hypothetical protein [Salmonella enterica subsp. enterica serovar Montevideo]